MSAVGCRSGRPRVCRAALLAIAVSLALAAPAPAASYPDGDGHTVDVIAPNLPADPARDQAFVDLLGGLVHWHEMGGVVLHLAADQPELSEWCGPTAHACVSGSTIHLRGWQTPHELRHVIAHEFGHIVHSARANPPLGSIVAGTKRWSSYEGICQGLRTGQYGDFDYYKTPREAFAQAYATLNFPDAPWPFDETLRPDAGALEAVRLDVLEPWQSTREAIEGKLTKRSKRASHELVLPLDGELSIRLKEAKALEAKMTLIAGATRKVREKGSLEHEVCGERTAILKVAALDRTRGAYEVTIERP